MFDAIISSSTQECIEENNISLQISKQREADTATVTKNINSQSFKDGFVRPVQHVKAKWTLKKVRVSYVSVVVKNGAKLSPNMTKAERMGPISMTGKIPLMSTTTKRTVLDSFSKFTYDSGTPNITDITHKRWDFQFRTKYIE